MADVLIAGGGIAGASLAIMLGRCGLAVELFERATFPREKPCGEGLMPAGVAVLQRWGLAEAVGGAPFYGVRYHAGGKMIEGRFPNQAGLPSAGLGQRRWVMDRVLLEHAAATSGVKVHEGIPVQAPLREHGRVTGLMVSGEARRAGLVVIADGLRSRLRCLLGLDCPSRHKRLGLRMHFRLAPRHTQPPWVEVFIQRGYEIYVTPLPDGEILVAALADGGRMVEPAELVFHRWVQAQPSLAARLEGAQERTTLKGVSPLSGRARTGVTPGAVLLGDAAGFLDPITGGGMTQALMTAELLTQYMVNAPGTDHDWLINFERERRVMLRDYHILTRMVLCLADYPQWAPIVLGALGHFPALFSHLVGVSGGVRRLLGRTPPPPVCLPMTCRW